MSRQIPRRSALLLPLAAAACGNEPPPRTSFPAPGYGYLTPLALNVADLTVDNQAPVRGPDDVSALDPLPPAQALARMAQDRLQALGSSGRAVFLIQDAAIVRVPGGLSGTLAVRLDILAANGSPAAFAEARVARRTSGDIPDLRGALYDMTLQMMNDMNVEFEFQVRRSLRDWLAAPAGAPAPVQSQELAPPAHP